MRIIIWEGVLGEIRYIETYISFLIACRLFAIQPLKTFLHLIFLTQSAVKCGLRAHILEALPAGLTAAMQIYTKPKISSHLYHPL